MMGAERAGTERQLSQPATMARSAAAIVVARYDLAACVMDDLLQHFQQFKRTVQCAGRFVFG